MENMEEKELALRNDMEIWQKGKLKCEIIWKISKKGKSNSDKRRTIWNKGKLNSEKI